MEVLKKILYLLDSHEKKKLIKLIIIIFIVSFFEILGIFSILPFVTILANPEIIENNYILSKLFKESLIFGIEDKNQFIFLLGFLVFFLLLISLVLRSCVTYFQLNFIFMNEYSLSKNMVAGYLNKPYYWFLNSNSSSIIKNILSEVSTIIGFAVSPLINLIVQSTIILIFFLVLLYVDFKLSLVILIIFGLSYLSIYLAASNILVRVGAERYKANESRFSILGNALGGIKEVKFGQLEKFYLEKFVLSSKEYAKTQIKSQLIGQLPRYGIEAILFGAILLLTLYLFAKSDNFNYALPTITFYLLSGYRLMPAAQQIYNAVTQLRFADKSINSLHKDLVTSNLNNLINNDNCQNSIEFKKYLKFEKINYTYPNAISSSLKDINIEIKKNCVYGLTGPSGGGKSTFIDVLLGLLKPQTGKIQIDDRFLDESNVRSWQKLIGYVPQNIFLIDDTISSNIAFGIEKKNIKKDCVIKSAKVSKIHDFIINELPDGYETNIGEKGSRLSGGQRQRIGIARALYNNPKILVFDEATNELDNITEKSVIESLYNLKSKVTIIIISHTISNLKRCDNIIYLEKGEIKRQGTFEQLKDDYKFLS
jgi:ABC-type bacteriocin/lantibiotic exporter with double-glycine peptidase domain